MVQELSIVKYIKKFGLAKAIQDFNLKCRTYNSKIHLKYDQIESDMSYPEVQDCRGLILERDTWKIMSMSFRKFFNHGESHAAKIDWNSAHVLEKVDGTMIQVYWDWHKKEWFAATTGTAEGEGEVNNKMGTTFNELFWSTVVKYNNIFKNLLDKSFTYVFELTTPYNIVVKPHGESSVTLLAIRSNETLQELSYENILAAGKWLQVPVVKCFDLNATDFGALIRTFEGMPWSEEGYVVVDGNFNRVKIKNPAYVAVHHLKSKTAEHNILTVVKANEIEEFAATFIERKDEVFSLKKKYDTLVSKLEDVWVILSDNLPKNITKEENKRYAAKVFEIVDKFDVKQFSGLYFSLKDKKVASVKDFIHEYDDKTLYKYLMGK